MSQNKRTILFKLIFSDTYWLKKEYKHPHFILENNQTLRLLMYSNCWGELEIDFITLYPFVIHSLHSFSLLVSSTWVLSHHFAGFALVSVFLPGAHKKRHHWGFLMKYRVLVSLSSPWIGCVCLCDLYNSKTTSERHFRTRLYDEWRKIWVGIEGRKGSSEECHKQRWAWR